jgi:adenylate kinase
MIIFTGVAGAGKSFQGKKLADEKGLPWLSTGEFLRMLISGERRKDMLAGKLLEDQEIIALVQRIFNVVDVKNEFVLDGFPRTVAQADWLLNQSKHGQLKITAVVNLQSDEATGKQRLLERGRQDDTDEAIAERFKEYAESIVPILEHFKDAGVTVHDIDGNQGMDKVHEDIMAALQAS